MEGLTYADVLLKPKRTPLKSRSEACTKTRLTKNVSLNIPLVSANMAAVTESKMAIALAREGGIGVIHQFMSIEDQAAEVRKVKRSTSHVIENPETVSKNITIKEAKKLMDNKGVTSLLVEENDVLIGIFTRRDYLFEDESKLVEEVMTKEVVTGSPSVSIEEATEILHKNRIEKLPLVENGVIKGLITTQDIVKNEYLVNAARDSKGRLLCAAAIGVKDAVERSAALVEAGVDVLVLDIAHGHSDFFIEKLKELKSKFSVDVLAGNIATAEAAKDLIDAGADGLKVGVGPSPVCTTRIVAGAGVPQVTAIMEVAKVAKQYNVPVNADGGITYPGDVVKAIVAGADTIMSGAIFSGTDEAPVPLLIKDGKRYKKYFGSASFENSINRKELSEGKKVKANFSTFVEGVSKLVGYKGPVEGVIDSFVRGVRSGISYSGSKDITGLKENGELIRITSNAWQESVSRDIRH